MGAYETRVNTLHAELTGGPTLGAYPDSVVDRLNAALNEAWDLVEAAGLASKVKVIAGTELGPYRDPITKLDDIRQQVLARYRYDEESRPRTLSEAAAQLQELVSVLVEGRDTPSDTPPAAGQLPAGTSQGELIWQPDHSKGDSRAAGYSSNVQRQGAGGSIQNSSDPVSIVNAPHDMGRALKFTIGADTTRLEVNPASSINSFPDSGERWFGFSVAFAKGFPLTARSWQLIAQLHGNDTISPRFSLQVNNGELRIGDSTTVCPVVAERRYDIVMRAELGSGHVTMWVDGDKKLDRYKCGTSKAPYYAKLGIYHDSSIAGGTVYHGPFRVGTGYGAVNPRR